MDIRFTVGELAKLNGISKQMLIYYDREGVFKPNIVDPENGYRYYTKDQLEALDSILLLKEMGLTLHEIKEHMQNRSGQATLHMLREQYHAVSQKLQRWEMIQKRLASKINSLETFYTMNGSSFFADYDREYLVLEKVAKPYTLLAVDIALKRLFRKASEKNYPHFYQLGDMVSVANLQKENCMCFDYVFLPLSDRMQGAQQYEKPKGTYARRYHTGSYETMKFTYQSMLHDIAEAGYEPIGYAYEYSILDSLTSKRNDEYITEIQIQVIKKP